MHQPTVSVRPRPSLFWFVLAHTAPNPCFDACRIYSGEIGDVGVVGGTKVTNSCVKTAPGAAEVSSKSLTYMF